MARKKNVKGKAVSEDRLFEVEYRLMAGEELDPAKWGDAMKALAEEYPDEFGYLLEDAEMNTEEN